MSYFHRMGGALSQLVNVALFNGHPNESVSARTWREGRSGWVKAIESVLKPGHCRRSYEDDLAWAKQLTNLPQTSSQ